MKGFTFLLFICLAGCTSLPEEKEELDDVPAKLRAEALLGYEYAQMAENTYKPHDTYDLPAGISNENHVDNDWSGLAYSIFHRVENDQLREVILSFRGTENNLVWFKDWIIGNILGVQNIRGLKVYEQLREDTPPSVPITVIGHSLGGGIALHISLRKEQVKTFVFNTSSRFTRGRALDNERHSYAEYGEANKILRVFTIDPKWTHSIFSCTYGDPLTNHSQVNLAACMTICASQIDTQGRALESINDNPKIFANSEMGDLACQ